MMLTLEEFAEKYDVGKHTIYTMRCTGALPKHIFTSNKRRPIRVDEDFFLRRRKFKNDLYNENERRYYILNEHISDYKLAGYLSEKTGVSQDNWYQWIYERFLTTFRGNVLTLKVSRNHRLFNKYTRRLVKQYE